MGDGGEQNAPLGRAVIGGLLFATCATLLFVPVVFSLVHRNDKRRHDDNAHSESSTDQPALETGESHVY